MRVLLEKLEKVLVVSINRPERRNAVDSATAEALIDTFEKFDQDQDLYVAVLTGKGGCFCAGVDMKAFIHGDARQLNESGPGSMGPTRMRLSKPVIAAVEGPAIGGGLELALWCDLRVATRDSVFGVYDRSYGVPMVDLGTVRLPRLIGHSRAMDMILTGRSISGEEAFAMGLVNRFVDSGECLPASIELAERLASYPQLSLRNDRLSAYEQWDLSELEAMRNEVKRALATIDSAETRKRFLAIYEEKVKQRKSGISDRSREG